MLGERILVGPHTFHEDTFYEYFEPYRHPEAHFDIWGGIGLETFDEDLEIVRQMNPEYVWTVVDGECGSGQWIAPGIRYIDRICYLVTREPHKWIDLGFRIPHSLSSLTPLGLRRQVTQLKRLIAEATSLQASSE
ncbi:MAG: hypothetical protein M0Q22_03415 [Sulfuritalea sp.]|nr:hypothetical protein [Sulfuritalea sp.]